MTLYKLDAIMDGDLFELIDSLTAADQAEKLSNMENLFQSGFVCTQPARPASLLSQVQTT